MTATVAGRSDYQERRNRRRAAVASMTRDGHSAAQIAAALGITPRTVQRDRRVTGTARDEAVPMSDAEHAHAARLAADGCSATEIARTLGRSRKTIVHHYPHAAFTREQTLDHIRLYHLERRLK